MFTFTYTKIEYTRDGINLPVAEAQRAQVFGATDIVEHKSAVFTKTAQTLKGLAVTQAELEAAGVWACEYHTYADNITKG
jgi:hypothetical protein